MAILIQKLIVAYNEFLADRIHQILRGQRINYHTKKMMGGLCFMVNNKMCCGIHYDKKKEMDVLMARIGEEAYKKTISREHCLPMDFTGRPMRGYVFVTQDGIDLEEDLVYYIDLCLRFNPLAKSSRKKI